MWKWPWHMHITHCEGLPQTGSREPLPRCSHGLMLLMPLTNHFALYQLSTHIAPAPKTATDHWQCTNNTCHTAIRCAVTSEACLSHMMVHIPAIQLSTPCMRKWMCGCASSWVSNDKICQNRNRIKLSLSVMEVHSSLLSVNDRDTYVHSTVTQSVTELPSFVTIQMKQLLHILTYSTRPT